MAFNKWLDTFLEEKGIDLEDSFILKDNSNTEHHIPYGVVIEHIKMATLEEQKAIKDMIVKIDFKNGDVRHFFRHIAQAIIN
jgi:hypothetical protein